MADEAKKITTRQSIQSKVQEANLARQKQVASSTAAAQEWSTTTPTVTATPKVTQTAKAMPSIERPDVTSIASRYQTTTPSTQIPTDLLSQRTVTLKKAETPDLLDWQTQSTWIAWLIDKWLYEKPQEITQKFWRGVMEETISAWKKFQESNLFESWKNVGIDTARFLISSAQWWLEKLWTMDLPVWWQTLNNSEMWAKIKEQRNNTFKAIFDKLESRDQRLSKNEWYKEQKRETEKWNETWKGIRQAMQEWKWDVVVDKRWEAVAQMLPALATSLITKDPKIVAWTVYSTVFWDAYKRNLTDVVKDPQYQNLTQKQKNNLVSLLATTEATIETLWDMLELAPFMKWKTSISQMLWIKNALLSFVVNWQWNALTESIEEGSTYILQTLLKQAYGSLDKISLRELWEIFSETYWTMQFAWLFWWVWWALETRNRNVQEKALEHEAEKFDNFNDFEAAAQRWWIEDKVLIQDAWAKSKWLTTKESEILKYDVNYVENQEEKATELYNEQWTIEKQLENLKENPEENQEKISKLETKLQEVNNQLEEIDRSIQEYMEVYWQQKEELPVQKQIQPTEWWENLSEQTMTTLPESQSSVKISQRIVKLSKNKLRNMFEKSVEDIDNWTKYKDTEFWEYIYASSWKDMILREKEKRDKMLNKVKSLLKTAWAKLRFVESSEKIDWAQWLYEPDIHRVSYIEWEKDVQVYWHEIFHAIRNLIRNNRVSNPDIQEKLDKIFNNAVEEVKKEFGMDWYTWKKWYYANLYAEEWLANAFWEYLANREIAWPKTFKEKIVDFFMRIIDFLTNAKVEKSISKELESAFETIARWEVSGTWGIPLFPQWMVFYDATTNPIESSTDITQEAMAEEKGEEYTNLVKEDELQSKQQEELWDHYENIVEAWKQSDKENSYEDLANEAPIIETTSDLQTTSQTVKNAFWKDKNKAIKAFSIMKSEATQAVKDIMTPALSRIYNISPRIAGRLVQMETQRDINIYRFRERAKPFVESVSKLSKKDKLEVKKALLDYWALASEQWENIEQYKQDEVKKLKETLNKYWITNEMIDNTVWVLNELWQKYKDAWLSITLTDMYFPRTVVDYEWLTQYISEKTWIAWKEKDNLLNRIAKIKRDEKLTDEEKEKRIRRLMTVDYKEPWTTSKHAKERKMWLLSEWGEWIYQFYADPMESLDNYIVNMENAIQRQLFLWWLQEEAWLKWENVSMTEIVEWLVDEWKISNEDLEELKKSVLAVIDKKPTPKVVSSLKNFTYVATLANFLSAINQLDDLAVVIIKDKAGLKNIVKSIFWKAWIKYTDLGLEDSYEMFRWKWNITNWFFKKSLFNAIDRLGKTSFINTAWDSLKSQAKNETARKNLIKRLTEMYGEETANHIMEKIDSWSYMTNWQIDIDILTDLLYQLGSTQPIYTSAMPTAYLNNGWVRLCYALQSFTIKRIDFLIEWTKQVYRNNWWWAKWSVAAWAWLMSVSVFLSLFWVAIWDLQDWIKWDEEETVLWKLWNEWINEALEEVWNEWKASRLKIWNLSLYDKNMYKRDWLWWVFMNKIKPPMIWIGNNFVEAITDHNADEISDLVQYVPIIWKMLYYWYFDEIWKETWVDSNWFKRRKEDSYVRREDSWFTRREEDGFIRRK